MYIKIIFTNEEDSKLRSVPAICSQLSRNLKFKQKTLLSQSKRSKLTTYSIWQTICQQLSAQQSKIKIALV